MKKILLATALSLCVSSAFAAETAVMKVTGTLTNAACTPELSNGGMIDYGQISVGALSNVTTNQLGQKNISLTINCTAATRVAWNVLDDRADSRADIAVENGTMSGATMTHPEQLFGVGKTAGGVNIGNYVMFMNVNNITADGQAVDPIYAQDGTTTWSRAIEGTLQGEKLRDITVAEKGTLVPKAFQTASFPLTSSLAIEDTSKLAITDDTELDGQLTISLRYL